MFKRSNNGSGFLTSPYLMALLAPAVVTGAMQVTWPFFEHNPIALYLTAVIFCAWYGGLGPGLLSVAISFLFSDFFFIEPYSLFQFHQQDDLVHAVLLIVLGPTISLLSELMHRERRRSIVNLNALRASEERYRKLAENFPNGAVITYDRDLRVTFIAGRSLQEVGLSPDHFLGKSLSEITPPEVVTLIEPQFQTAFGGRVVTYECPFPNGKTYSAAVAPLQNGNGLINEILVVSQDITQRKQVEQDLRASETKYRRLLDSSIVGVIFWSLKGEILYANDLFLSMTGYTREDLSLGRLSWKNITPPEYAHVDEQAISQLMTTGTCPPFEKEYLRKDGSRVSVLIGSALLEGEKGTGSSFIMDITERKQAEETLAKAAAIVESSDDAIIGKTLEGIITSWNKGAARVYGYKAEEVIGRPICILIPPEHGDELPQILERVRRGERVDHYETRHLRKDNTRILVSLSVSPVEDGVGRIVGAAAIARDITERKRAQESLKLFRNLIDQSSDAIEVLDPNTLRFLDCNATAHQVLGYTREDFLALTAFHIDPVIDQAMLSRLGEEMEKSGFVIFESVHRRKDGSTFPVEINAMNIRSERNYRLAVVRDITDRKRAEAALRNAERKYRDFFENAGEGIFQSTPDGRYLAANPALAHMYGFASPEELIQSSHDISRQIYVDPTRRDDFKCQLAEHGAVRGFEHQAFRKDRSKIWISVNARVVRDEKGNIQYYEGTAQDITDRKQTEGELLRQKEILQRIVDHIPVMINFTASDGRIILVNREWQQTLGWSLEEIHREDLDVFAKCYPTPQARQDALDFVAAADGDWRDFKTQTRDGRVIDTSWVRVKLSDGTTIGIGQDITARKQSEMALRQAERKYREIFENAGEGIFQSTPDGRFLVANPALAHMGGYASPEELIQSSPDIAQQIYVDPTRREDFKRQLDEQGSLRGFEYEAFRKDQSKIWISVNARAVRDEKGETQYFEGTAQEITDRKRAEEALRESEERYRDLVENSLDLICTHDLDGLVLSANRAAMELMGYSSGTYAGGINFRQILAPEVRDQFDDYLKRIRTNGAASGLMLVQTRSGEKRIWEYHCTLRTEGIAAPIVRGVARDITDRKQAEAFRASEKQMLEMIASGRPLPDVLNALTRLVEKQSKGLSCSILLLDADGTRLRHGAAHSLPDSYCRALDGAPIGPTAGSCGTAAFRKGLVVVEDIATDPLWKDYREPALEHGLRACWSTPILTADGNVLGTFAMYYLESRRPGPTDLELIERATHLAAIAIERQQAEQALRQAEQKYRELFENAKQAIYVHDLSGKYTSLNRAAELLSGYSREEILGKHFSNFVAPEYEEGVRENLCRKLLERGETTYEIEIIAKDGRRVPVEVSSRLIYEEDVAVGVQGTVHNTVERKRAEEALRGYSRQLIKAQEAERQRISRELHDQIGQVLTVIRINLETIRDSSNQAESKVLIDEGVTIVDQAIQQVRDLSFELRPSLLDNLGLVAALRWYSDQYTKRTGIRTRSVTNLRGSQTRLSQELETTCFRIVQEALTNVVRHANAKNVSIDLRKVDHKIILSIKDDGVGFDESANGAASATHLGLRGMKERALALGGTLRIESGPARGTEIRALFPTESKEN